MLEIRSVRYDATEGLVYALEDEQVEGRDVFKDHVQELDDGEDFAGCELVAM